MLEKEKIKISEELNDLNLIFSLCFSLHYVYSVTN